MVQPSQPTLDQTEYDEGLSQAEDQQVCEELRRGIDFYQIAKTHNRSIGSIVARLVKLGKIGPNTPLDMLDPKVA